MACRVDDRIEINLRCGTPGYFAPEILSGNSFTTKADIFSLGVLFYNILTRKTLFSGRDMNDVMKINAFMDPAM